MKIYISDYFLNPKNENKIYTSKTNVPEVYLIRKELNTNRYCISLGADYNNQIVYIPEDYIHAHSVVVNTDTFKVSDPIYVDNSDVGLKFKISDRNSLIVEIELYNKYEFLTIPSTNLILNIHEHIKDKIDEFKLNNETCELLYNLVNKIKSSISMANTLNEVPTPIIQHAKYWECPICHEYTTTDSNVCCKCGYNRTNPDYKKYENLEGSSNKDLKHLNETVVKSY
jgi:hypothetical protein